MDANYVWLYLAIFMMIPLVRVIQRAMAKRRAGGGAPGSPPEGRPRQSQDQHEKPTPESGRRTPRMLVLGSLNRGFKTFEDVQKNTGLGSDELDAILGDLEKDGMLAVRQKQGIMGPKVEIYPTDKGFKAYYS